MHLVPVFFTFYIGCAKIKKNNFGAKRLSTKSKTGRATGELKQYILKNDWEVEERYVDVVYNLVLSIVCQWDNYDEQTSCKMEHILLFLLRVALQKKMLVAGLDLEEQKNYFHEVSLLVYVIYFCRV